MIACSEWLVSGMHSEVEMMGEASSVDFSSNLDKHLKGNHLQGRAVGLARLIQHGGSTGWMDRVASSCVVNTAICSHTPWMPAAWVPLGMTQR